MPSEDLLFFKVRGDGNVKNAWNVAVAACVSGAIGYFVGLQMHSGGTVGTPLRAENRAAQQAPLPPGSEAVYKVPVGAAPVKGDPEAKITIVEFSDFECPYCGRAVEVVKQVEARYGKDLRLAFKHNPLPMHPDAPTRRWRRAGRARTCTNRW